MPLRDYGKGLHVVAPLVRGPGWEEVRGFAHDLALHFARRDPTRSRRPSPEGGARGGS